MNITVKTIDKNEFQVELNLDATLEDLKKKIAEVRQIEIELIKIIYSEKRF